MVTLGLSWLSNSDEAQFAAAEVGDLRQQFFISVFPKLEQFLTSFFTSNVIAMPISTYLHSILRCEQLLVKEKKKTTLSSVMLILKTSILYDCFYSFIAKLCSMPQENH
jgi:hypothetical protein